MVDGNAEVGGLALVIEVVVSEGSEDGGLVWGGLSSLRRGRDLEQEEIVAVARRAGHFTVTLEGQAAVLASGDREDARAVGLEGSEACEDGAVRQPAEARVGAGDVVDKVLLGSDVQSASRNAVHRVVATVK